MAHECLPYRRLLAALGAPTIRWRKRFALLRDRTADAFKSASGVSAIGRGESLAQNGWAQYSTGRSLPCLTMISCNIETEAADASVVVVAVGSDFDQAMTIAATQTIPATVMILRMLL